MALGNNGWNDLNTIRNINNKLQPIFSLAVDIHLHSHQIGANCLDALRLDQQHQLSSNARNFETVATEILAHSKNNPNVATLLNRIRASRNAIENETGLNIADLLVRTWDLTTKARYNNARDAVIDNLNDNILAGGGCLAGIAARLAQPYLALLANGLEQHLVQPQRPAYTPRYNNNQNMMNMDMSEEEELVTRAIALSQQPASRVQDNDADFNRAVQLSLQQNPSAYTGPSEAEQMAWALNGGDIAEENDPELEAALNRSKYWY